MLHPAKIEIDWILYNGNIYTVDDQFSIVTAMAIDNGLILDTGTDEEILQNIHPLKQLT